MRWLFIGVWLVLILSITSFVWLIKVPINNQHSYYTSLISESNTQSSMTVFGKIIFEEETTLLPASDGNVMEVLVKAGDTVTKGQILATLDFDINELNEYEKLKQLTLESGSIESLNNSLKKIAKLEKQGFYDATEASSKRSEIYTNLTRLMNYKTELKKQYDVTHGKIIRAPFDGIVTDIRLKKGQRVNIRDDQSFNLISVVPKNFKAGVEIEVSDELLFRLEKGQEISVSSPLSEDAIYKGSITAISHQAFDDKKKRYFKVIGKLNDLNPSGLKIASGMKVSVSIETSKESNITWIPKSSFDIFINKGLISSKIDYTPSATRSIASTKSRDFYDESNTNNQESFESNVSRTVGNELFPKESQFSEIYLLMADNKIVEVKVLKIKESGEMVAVQGEELKGMRVITHYRPKESLW